MRTDYAEAPVWARLGDGRRLRGLHGPIDLIIEASGDERAVQSAEQAAMAAFGTVLPDLASELPELRRQLGARPHVLNGTIARSMLAAVDSLRDSGITPMAAVAGAVADHLLATMLAAQDAAQDAGKGNTAGDAQDDATADAAGDAMGGLDRVSVNNGGDIALFLAPGQSFTVGLHGDVAVEALSAGIVVQADSGIGGIATSGWRGRSHSLGIADAVTVLASNAARADAAATIIANAVDLPGNGRIRRVPARELAPDSDLGDRPVTIDVATLSELERRQAVARGTRVARACLRRGLIVAARIELQATSTVVSGSTPDNGGQAWIT